MWETVGQVSSIFSLLAFFAAAIAYVLRRRLKSREELVKAAPEEDRARLAEAVLDRFSVDTTNLTRYQRYDLAREVIRRRSERLRWGLTTFATVFLISAVLAVYAFISLNRPAMSPIYTLRVVAVGPDGQPVAGTTVGASVDAVMKQVGETWQLEIPAAKVPADGRIEIWVAKKTAFLSGSGEVTLGDELRRTVRIELGKVQAEVGGLVIDEENRPVAGARVFVIGYPGQGFETGPDGQFLLSTAAADGEEVALRAEKEGYEPIEEYPYAGDRSVRMKLRPLQ